MITIQYKTTIFIRTAVYPLAQGLFYQPPASTTVLRRVAWLNHSHISTGAFCLVGSVIDDLIPRSVLNRLGKVMIPYHGSYPQIFKEDHSIADNKRMAQLVSIVAALITDSLMYSCHFLSGFLSLFASFRRFT